MTSRSKARETWDLYARTSGDEQREQQTIKTQLEFARKIAAAHDVELREWIDDGVSGKKMPFAKRPAGARLLAAIERGEVATVVSYRLDRLGRRARFILEALEHFAVRGIAYRSLTEPYDTSSPAGKLLITMLAAVSEFESDSIFQRTSDGRARVAQIDHRWLGGPTPYGYVLEHRPPAKGGVLVVDESPISGVLFEGKPISEAGVVRLIHRRAAEGRGILPIIEELNASGIPYRSGRKDAARRWYYAAVQRILHKELYVGRMTYFRAAKTPRELAHRASEAILDPRDFAAAQRAIAERNPYSRSHAKRDYLLRGLLRCTEHPTRALYGRQWRSNAQRRDGATRNAYVCPIHANGERPMVLEEPIVEAVWADLLAHLADPDRIVRAALVAESNAGSAEDRAERELLELDARRRQLEQDEERLVDAMLAGTFSAEILDRKLKAVRSEQAKLRTRRDAIASARAEAAAKAQASADLRSNLAALAREAAKRTASAERVALLRRVVRRIDVRRTGPRGAAALTAHYHFAEEPAALRAACSDYSAATMKG